MKDKKQSKKKPILYRIIRKIILAFYKKREFVGLENVPDEPVMFIGNHAQMNGPLTSELFFPLKKQIWCIGNMMHLKEVPAYAFKDFWLNKPKWNRWFYKILSYIIAPLCCLVFNHSDTIGVYKDARIINTYKQTLQHLQNGENIIIFPEKLEPYNEIVYEFQDKFIDVAKMYYNKYKKAISFVPMYNAATLKKVVFGKPIKYNPEMDINEQRKAICDYLKTEITKLAKELPAHIVVSYANIGRKNYKMSKDISRKKSINVYYAKDVDTRQKLNLIKKFGYQEYFVGLNEKGETLKFEDQVECGNKLGLKCSMVHCEYFDGIMDNFWLNNEVGEQILNSYLEQIKRCANATKNFVVHLNESADCPVSEIGLQRIEILLKECEKYDLNLCVENLESTKEIPYIFKNINHKNLKICYDVGHKNFLYPQFDIYKEYSKYVTVLHIHDNNGKKDEHKICFSGTVDWKTFAKQISNTDLVLCSEIKIKDKTKFKSSLKKNLKALQKLEKMINKCE